MNTVQAAQDLHEKYGHLDGEDLLRPLLHDVFPEEIALVSSFGAEAAVLLAMVARIKPETPVIFLDTQKLFPETLVYRDTLTEHLKLSDVRTIYPDYADTARHDPDGNLWQRDVNACCYMRKVAPLKRALKGFKAWITGRKRYQGGLRTSIPALEAFEGRIKINPLASWTRDDMMAAYEQYDLPRHPLSAEGYTSIGCIPCTAKPASEEDMRSGRWAGTDKQECGIHLGDDGKFYPAGRS